MKLDYDIILVDISEVMSEYDSKLDQSIDEAISVILGYREIIVESIVKERDGSVWDRRALLEKEGKKVLLARVTKSTPEEIGIEEYFKVEVASKDIGLPDNGKNVAVHFKKEYVE